MGNSQVHSTLKPPSDTTKFIPKCDELKDIDFSFIFKELQDEIISDPESDAEYNDIKEILDFVPLENQISDIWRLFEFEKQLGKGGSCTVMLVTKVSEDGSKTQYALKALEKSFSNKHLFTQEVNIMKKLQESTIHTNVVKFVDCYIDYDSYYILLEYGCGGTMLQRVLSSKYFCERTAAKWIKTILDGVQYFHSLNIVHRDLKADNFIFDSMEENANLKIIDFGNSHQIGDDEEDNMIIGGKHYLPPEAFRNQKGWELRKSDMWMIGICTYILLCGKYPFHGVTTDELYEKIRKGRFIWPKKIHLSDTCKDFVQNLLCLDVDQRFSPSEALQHPWITGFASGKHLGEDYFHQLKLFAESNRLEQILVTGMLTSMNTRELRDLPSILKELSLETNGTIDFADVIHYMLVNSDLEKISEFEQCEITSEYLDIDGLLDEIEQNEMKTEDIPKVDISKGESESVVLVNINVMVKKMKSVKLQQFDQRVHTPKIRVETLERLLRQSSESEEAIHRIVLALNPTISEKIEITKIHTFIETLA